VFRSAVPSSCCLRLSSSVCGREWSRWIATLRLAERGRRPRVVSVQLLGTTPGFVVATATIDDGGLAAYQLRFTLQGQSGRWAVSSVVEG
jgi:hypothetical protein